MKEQWFTGHLTGEGAAKEKWNIDPSPHGKKQKRKQKKGIRGVHEGRTDDQSLHLPFRGKGEVWDKALNGGSASCMVNGKKR